MSVASLADRQLVIEVPAGRLEHPLPDDVDPCTIIARLAPHVPADAVWSVRPPRHNPG